MAEGESSLAVLVDYENMARPGAKGRADFDIHAVLNRLSDKGRVIVKRAYADWSRYRDARHELQNAGLGLIEMPSAREGAKNRADIQLVVDAMELAYSRTHVDAFVIVSGDSDFTPLVGKLRELGKRVIGVGNRDSASELLIANCDEFIFYDSISRRGGRAVSPSESPDQLLRETLGALSREGTDWPLASIVKDSMRRKAPAFDQSDHGFSTFSKLLEDASKRGVLKLESDPRSGTYRVGLPDDAAPSTGAPARDDGSSEGGGRSRRRRRRGGAGAGEDAPEPTTARGGRAAAAAAADAEVFEIVVTPDIEEPSDADLPPIDQPISYEDMIMLGPAPEAGDDVPKLIEASDSGGEAAAEDGDAPKPPRRRRRRKADDADEAAAPAEPEAAEEAKGDEQEDAEDEAAAESGRRGRRVRRRGGSKDAEPAPETPAEDAEPAPETPAPELAEEVVAEAPESPTDEPEQADAAADAAAEGIPRAGKRIPRKKADDAAEDEKPKRRRRTTKKADEPATAEEAPAEDEKPKRRRRTTKKADEPATAEEAPAEDEKPKRRRRTTKKADEPATAEEAPAEDEKPKRRRRTTKKADEPATAEEAPAEDEKPKRRRRTTKKADEAES